MLGAGDGVQLTENLAEYMHEVLASVPSASQNRNGGTRPTILALEVKVCHYLWLHNKVYSQPELLMILERERGILGGGGALAKCSQLTGFRN